MWRPDKTTDGTHRPSLERRRPSRVVLALFALPLVAYAVVVGLVMSQQRNMLFMTGDDGQLAAAAGLAVPGSEKIALVAADGIETAAWYVAPSAGKPTFLFLHGQGGQLIIQKRRWRRLREAGIGVLALSYRGYPGSQGGPNSGQPSEDGIARDARAAYDWLRQRHPAGEIVIHGHSLGSGVAVGLAAEIGGTEQVRAVVLEAPFTAAVDVAGERMPWAPAGLLMWDQFRSRDRITKVMAPLLIVHGDRDSVIPFAHAERLLALAREPKTLVRMAGSDHNTLVRDGLFEHVFPFVGVR